MDDSLAEVMRLLALAQTGNREQALELVDEVLSVAESPGMLYARAVTVHSIGDHEAAAEAAERMLAITAAPGQGEVTGWRSIALAFRAWQNLLLPKSGAPGADLESIMHDLVHAEAMLSSDVSDAFGLATAHTCLGNAYHELRLYELARPNFEAAFAVATADSAAVVVDRAVASQLNLATMHLNWSVELHRIRDSEGAQEKGAVAAKHAALAREYAVTEETQQYAAHAEMLLACANSLGGGDGSAVDQIRDALRVLEGRGLRESPSYALPFLARALDRAGEHTQALEVAEQAIRALPEDATWMVASAAYHTQASLLAQLGSDSARAALAYGDQLAETMWAQRLRTLHDVSSKQFLERVLLERDRVRVLANTDALTGIGNRRAFDFRMVELGSSTSPLHRVALIVVDVDRLKVVNDMHGHEAGDRTLKAIAGALTSQVRSDDLVARLGGDEFVAVLDGMDRAAAGEVAERMVAAVAAAVGPTVTISVGVATGPAAEAGSSLLRAADRAMYTAKRNRRVAMTGSHSSLPEEAHPN